MTRECAVEVVKMLEEKNGPVLSVLEAMSMVEIPSDSYRIFAIQKGDVTFLAWFCKNGKTHLVKTVSW